MSDSCGEPTPVSAEVAFSAFYGQHYGLVLAYAQRRVPEDAARDVASEVFTVAWRRWPLAAEGGLPWLYTTAAHLVGTAWRGQRRGRALAGRLSAHHVEQAVPDHAEAHAERDVVLAAVRSLGPQDRELLLLTVWEHLDVAAAARVVGISPGAAHVRLHRARRRLRVLLSARGVAPTTDPPDPGVHHATPARPMAAASRSPRRTQEARP